MQLRDAWVCLSLLGVLTVPVHRARACGPHFPAELLRSRADTLANLPESDFLFDVTRLVPKPAHAFTVVEEGEPEGARIGGGARETELYAAGAKAFEAGNWDGALERFQEVLALPAEERRRFSTFAAYMIGRIQGETPAAREAYAQVRELVLQGFEDPAGLAVSSLGQEARLHLNAGDDVGAIALYAEQAAHGSASGANSLLFVARALARDEARLRGALRSPVGQRLMATYAWTRGNEEMWWEDEGAVKRMSLERLLDVLASEPRLAGADRLAATAWQEGRFDVAERFASVESTPLAAWVKAKLAMRRGDRAAAEQLLAEASAGFPVAENWETSPYEYALRPHANVEGERTILALMRGDVPQATEHVLKTCSWPDIAYVAERVLSVDELQRVLANQATSAELRCKPSFRWFEEEEAAAAPTVNDQLRLLLGRRLMRDGQEARALDYFRGTKWEESSRQYVDARERARSSWNSVDQAEALHAASRLARRAGFELMGTEVAPDWVWAYGDFEMDSFYSYDEEEKPAHPERRAWQANLVFIPQSERERLEAHAPPHLRRFHYRSTAADLAEKAAELVPPRSQAYAALLCHAARFTASSEPERGQRLWSTYVKKGALLSEPMAFGASCPEPNFERVRAQRYGMPTLRAPRLRTLATVGGGLLLPVVGLVLLRRRRREPQAPGGGT